MSTVKVSAFPWVPPFAQGLVRELRVRWALSELGRSYEELLIGFEDQKSSAYRKLQPFGQVPVFQDGALTLFESGGIVLHLAEQSDVLLPREAAARARAKCWMFAALNSMEPHIQQLGELRNFHADADWAKQLSPLLEDIARTRLKDLATYLEGRTYLESERFSAADLLMTTVLRVLRDSALLDEQPRLQDYRARCEARPAFQKALAEHMANFARHTPPG